MEFKIKKALLKGEVMFKSIVVAAFLFAGISAWAGSVGTTKHKITKLVAKANAKDVTVWVNGPQISNPAGCKFGDRYMINLQDDFLSRNIFSMLMTATTTKQDIEFQIDDKQCITWSNGNSFPIIVSVKLN